MGKPKTNKPATKKNGGLKGEKIFANVLFIAGLVVVVIFLLQSL